MIQTAQHMLLFNSKCLDLALTSLMVGKMRWPWGCSCLLTPRKSPHEVKMITTLLVSKIVRETNCSMLRAGHQQPQLLKERTESSLLIWASEGFASEVPLLWLYSRMANFCKSRFVYQRRTRTHTLPISRLLWSSHEENYVKMHCN